MTQTAHMISFQSGTRQHDGYLARPEGGGPFPSLVLMHEASGLNENMKDIARLCPVVGSYPGNDFTARSGQKLDVELDRYHVPHDIKIYPGTKHAYRSCP